jgi:ribosome-associated protein
MASAAEPRSLADDIATFALDRKAEEVVVIDVTGRCSYADFLVVASGTSDRHVTAIAESVQGELHARGRRVLGREGLREGQWALIDAGDVVLHVFHAFTRSEVDLDGLWREAPRHRRASEPPKVASLT